MSRCILVLLVLVCCPSVSGEAPDKAAAPAAGLTILVVGDSLSAGFGLRPGEAWPGLLEDRLASLGIQNDVVNASISGDTTRGALSRLPRALEVHAPDIVIIELGGNDGLRGFPIDVMRENLKSMIDMCRDAGARVLLLGMRLPPNYGPEYTGKFHQVYVDLAERQEVSLVKFFLADVATDPDLMQADGIHPTAAAQPILLDNIWPALQSLLASADRSANQVDSPVDDSVQSPKQGMTAPEKRPAASQ